VAALSVVGLAVAPASAAASCTTNCTVWNPGTQPTGQSVFNDSKSVELGLKFHSDINGTVTGVRFYKDPSEGGSHVGHLWSATGTKLAEVTFSETASGWQQANFPAPVAITAGTDYWISEFTSDGTYVATVNWPYPQDNSPLHGTAAAYHYFGGFPDTPSLNDANYWVDVVFQPGIADVSITNQAPSLVLLGDRLTYSIGVRNSGPATATGVTVTNPVPGGSTFVSASSSQGTCSQAQGTVTCTLGSLAPGATASVTIKTDPKLLGRVNDTATVRANEVDPQPANNSATASTFVLLSLL
jgi:uncharacterized repeat protein (TIGR01451 family)